MNLFEQASRDKLRFSTNKGDLTVEQLWDLPLQSARNGLSLDSVAQAVNEKLKAVSTESFVSTGSNPLKGQYERALDILKHVIAVRQEENAQKRTATERAAERERLLSLLDKKRDEALGQMSEDDIKARLAEIDSQ